MINTDFLLGYGAGKASWKSVDSFRAIQKIVQNGDANKYFSIGDQIELPWKSTAGTDYALPFDVVSFDSVYAEGDSSTRPGLWLQSHYGIDAVQFDASEAAFVTTAALPAGTYNITIGTSWGTHCVSGKSYAFTTTKEVPAGGQIVFSRSGTNIYTWGAPDYDPANWVCYTFASADSTTPLDSALPLTEASTGTNLGSLKSDTKYAESGINNLQRAAYGYNRWSMSAIRQFVNSGAAAGSWWTPQHPFDRPPQQLASLRGFMGGFSEEFLEVLGKVKVTTALNTVSDSQIGTSEDTYDTFFLSSLEQEYVVPQLADAEGAYWPYWKDRLELESPQEQGSGGANANHIRYAYDARTSAQYVRLRSANRYYANSVCYVYTTGYAYSNAATYAIRSCPACVIC